MRHNGLIGTKEGRNVDTVATKESGSTADDGCPVRNKKSSLVYDLYSQPLDPKNNVPAVANQLPSPDQSSSLPTEHVKSNIPKVR